MFYYSFKLLNKIWLENATGVNMSDFAKQADLAGLKLEVDKLPIDELKNVPKGLKSLKIKVDKLDIGRLKTTPVDFSKLSDAVKNYVAKKTDSDQLVKKVNATDTSKLVNKKVLMLRSKISKLKYIVLLA